MKIRVATSHEKTSVALTEARSLRGRQTRVQAKQDILAAFREQYFLSEDEIAALTLSAEPVDDRFFMALDKAKQISKDCELLLGFERQVLGTELMEQISRNVNLGFQKLFRSVHRAFKTINLENPSMNPTIRRALRVLTERPSLFQQCLDFFAEARERVLTDAFHVALTGTTSTGRDDPTVKPIDLTAHDPLRYVGDMLAWAHSATVSEREALEVLFVAEGEELAAGIKSGRNTELWGLLADGDDQKATDFNAVQALNDLVDRDVAGAARTLRQRVEQVVQSNEDILSAYKLANLIKFYRVTFQNVLGSKSTLSTSVADIEAKALRQFRALVRDSTAMLQGEFQQTPANLGPPTFFQASLEQLRAIARTYETSLTSPGSDEDEFDDVLNEAFEPFMSGCDNMARSIPSPNQSIFRTNCRLAAKSCLDGFDFARVRLDKLQKEVDLEMVALVAEQYHWMLQVSGLQVMISRLNKVPASELSQEDLRATSQQLDDFLPSALIDAMERLTQLRDVSLARTITGQASERFCTDFERLEAALLEKDAEADLDDPASEGLRSALPRTTAEIRVLMS